MNNRIYDATWRARPFEAIRLAKAKAAELRALGSNTAADVLLCSTYYAMANTHFAKVLRRQPWWLPFVLFWRWQCSTLLSGLVETSRLSSLATNEVDTIGQIVLRYRSGFLGLIGRRRDHEALRYFTEALGRADLSRGARALIVVKQAGMAYRRGVRDEVRKDFLLAYSDKEIEPEKRVRVLSEVARYFMKEQAFEEAREALEEALDLAEAHRFYSQQDKLRFQMDRLPRF